MTRLAEALKKKISDPDYAKKNLYDICVLIDCSMIALEDILYGDRLFSVTIGDYVKICAWLGVDPKEYLEDYK